MFPAPSHVLRQREGTFTELPFPLLLNALAVEERTCTLELRVRQREKRITFEDGAPVGCVSNLLHETLGNAVDAQNTTAIIILVTLVVLMIASQFFTQLQIISKNLSPEAKTGQAYQMQKIMLYVLPLGFIFSGVFFPLGVVMYWFTSNIWTMVQQFVVIRNLPTPGSEAAKAREERLAKKGKALDASGKVIPLAKYEAEQQRLFEEAERAKAQAPKRQQPVSKQRAKKQAQKGKQDGTS